MEQNENWEFIQNSEKSGGTKQKKNLTVRLGKSYQPWAGVPKGRRMLNIDQEITIFLDWICKMGKECYPERKSCYCSLAGNEKPTLSKGNVVKWHRCPTVVLAGGASQCC